MYKLTVFIPESHLESVKNALFMAGAGQLGNYSHCAWQVLGQGQFMPLSGNQAFIGVTGRLEVLGEWRVEMVVTADKLLGVITALKLAHPYETPAYHVVQGIDI